MNPAPPVTSVCMVRQGSGSGDLASARRDPYTSPRDRCGAPAGGFDNRRARSVHVDSELHFEWPGAARAQHDESRPLARRRSPRMPKDAPAPEAPPLQRQLDEARVTIACLEVDRHAARTRIDELQAARDALEARVTLQRRRLLLLERQLEDANVEPAWETSPRASW